jgi:hypothetical protein
METLRTIADDLLLTAKQEFDDRKISLMQMRYWVLIAADRLLSQRIEKQGTETQGRSGRWMTTFVLTIQENNHVEPNVNTICGRYVNLPEDVYDYQNDRGIDYMITYAGDGCDGCPPGFEIQFTRTTPRLMGARGSTAYEKPSVRNPKWYREQNRLWLLGHETVPLSVIGKVQVGLLCTLPDVNEARLDEPLNFPKERIDLLCRQVLDRIRLDISMPNTKLRNDGTEGPPVVMPGRPNTSVNDPSVTAV